MSVPALGREARLGVIAACTIGLVATVALARDGENDLSWAILHDSNSLAGSGSETDWEAIGRLQKKGVHDVLYARIDRQRYLISDPAVIRKVEELMAPQAPLEREQERLSLEQDRNADAQSALGDRESVLDDRADEITERTERMVEDEVRRAAETPDRARQEELRKKRAALREERRKIEIEREEIQDQMAALEAADRDLNRRMQELDRRQEALEQQIEDAVRGLLRDAVARGLASPLPR